MPALESSSGLSTAKAGDSFETRIGSQVFNRIGIVAVLVGVAWFLKFAIDNQWIGPAGRVAVGLIAGAGITALSERFRTRGYAAFSYSLKATATGVLYLSLWAAYALFHLVNGKVAFLAMVMVTSMNALMCWMQDSEVLAFYAAIGGFITPLLLAVHGSTELVLFGYLLLLDIAVVALITLRPWPRLLLAAFAGTTFYFIGWYASGYSEEKFGLTLFFIVTFFLLFAVSPHLLRRLHRFSRESPSIIENSLAARLLPVLNALLGFAEVFALASNFGHRHLDPWIALPFAAFYLLMLRLSRSASREDASGVLPAIDLTLCIVFITIAIPMIFHGYWVAAGWFLEFAVLLWLAARAADRILRVLAVCALALAIVALLLPPDLSPAFAPAVLLNPRFATYLWAIAACLFAAKFSSVKSADICDDTVWPAWRPLAGASVLIATLLAMIAVCLEIHGYWNRAASHTAGSAIDEQFTYSAWMMLFGAALLATGFWRRSAFLRWEALVLLALSIAKVFLFDTRQLSQGYRIVSFLGLGALLLVVSFAYQKDWLSLRGNSSK